MSDRRDDELEPDVVGVLRAAAPVAVDASVRARVLAGVETRIAAFGGGGHGGSSAGGSSAGGGLGRLLASKPALSLAVAFLAGGGAGALLRGAPAPRVIVVEKALSSAPAPGAPPIEPTPTRTAEPAEVASAAPPANAPVHAAPLDSSAGLAAESALLDVARTALARGEPDHALAAVARHAAQFPRGALAEEREALAVKALAQAGRGTEARARADRFRSRYPKSLFGTAVDASTPPSSTESIHEMDPKAPRQP